MAISPEQQKTVNAVRFALRANGISPAAQQAFRGKSPNIFSPKAVAAPSAEKSTEKAKVVLTPDQIKAGQYGELIDKIKKDPKFAELFKGQAPDAATLDKILSSTKTAGEKSDTGTASVARPYRLKIGDQVQSFQIVDGKWKQIDSDHWVRTRQAQAVRDAPTYLLATLNATKKKVDAQRAAGNLTDSRRIKGKPLV